MGLCICVPAPRFELVSAHTISLPRKSKYCDIVGSILSILMVSYPMQAIICGELGKLGFVPDVFAQSGQTEGRKPHGED